MDKLVPSRTETGSLMNSTVGYYKEMYIQNCTASNIVLIDNQNNKSVIPPVNPYVNGSESVFVWWRSAIKEMLDNRGKPLPCDGACLRIPKHFFAGQGSVTIPQLDIILCSELTAQSINHPAVGVDNEAAICALKEELAALSKKAPTITIVANDPKGRYPNLYTMVGDMLITIPVTTRLGKASLKIAYSCDTNVQEFEIPLEEWLNGSDAVLDIDDCPIAFVTTNHAVAERSVRDHRKLSQKEVNTLLSEQQTKAKKEIDELEKRHKANEESYVNKLQVLESELKLVKAEYDKIKSEYDTFTGNVSANVRMSEHHADVEKARRSENTEQWKSVATIGGVAVGGIALGAKLATIFKAAGIIALCLL